MKKSHHQLRLKDRAKERSLFLRRLLISAAIVLLLTILLIARLVYLQIIKHPYYTTLSKQNAITLIPIPPKRGLIYDRNGVLLAKNIPVFSLMITPEKISNLQKEIQNIQSIIPISKTDLQVFHRQARQRRPFQKIPLKLKLSQKQVAEFAVNRYRFPGFSVKAELIREYPFGKNFAHLIGYVGRINEAELNEVNPSNYADTNYFGKTGIEAYYEKILHGTVGYKRVETDASGRIIRTISTTPPVAGSNLYLTIDSKLQLAVEKAMKGLNGAVIVMQPQTGQVLAMVSTPSFNPNAFVQGISNKAFNKLLDNPYHPLYNRTILGLYSIGSTNKPFMGLAGLDAGVITPQYKIFDPGWFRIPGTKHIFHDWLRTGHGWIGLHRAIVVSCDTYFYNLAYKLGIKPIDNILYEFGFGHTTGIELPGELAGIVPSPASKMRLTGKPWYTGDTVNTVIGQGFSQTTPLQLAAATTILANRGGHFKPTLLYAMQPAGQAKILNQPDELPPIMLKDPKSWQIVINAMHDVIPHGTGFAFGRTPYTVAAKTGTAQVRDDDGRVINTADRPKRFRSNSTFIAFAPIKKPIITVAVVVEHVPDAAPKITREIMDYYLIKQHHWKPAHSASLRPHKK